MSKRKVTVILSAGSMGEVSIDEFDTWAAYVTDKIDDLTGLDVTIDQHPFGWGGDTSIIDNSRQDEEDIDKESVHEALNTLWDEFCLEGGS